MDQRIEDNRDYKFYEYQMQRSSNGNSGNNIKIEPSGLVIEDNTVYEIDDECIKCLKEKMIHKERSL
jgi:hypothetical protein